MSKKGSPDTVGGKYGRRWFNEQNTELGVSRIEQLEPDSSPSVARRKAHAVAFLEGAGIPANELLAQDRSGAILRERVIHIDEHELDSKFGLAARICYDCCQIEGWSQIPGSESRLIAFAFSLGRLSMLARAYGMDAAQASSAAKASRPNAKSKMKQAVIEIMKAPSIERTPFKEFLRAWETDPIEGLRLADRGNSKYLVTDENRDLGEAEYTFQTLNRIYSESKS